MTLLDVMFFWWFGIAGLVMLVVSAVEKNGDDRDK